MLRALIVVLALLIPSVASPQSVRMLKEDLSSAVINDLAINAARWTGWISVPYHRSVTLEVNYTWSAASAVTMRCETSDDTDTANDSGFDLHILSDSATAGTSNSNTHTWSNAVTASEKWTWTAANLPHNFINCVFNGTGADGSDKVTVKHKRITP